MNIVQKNNDKAAIVVLSGRIDSVTSTEFDKFITNIIEENSFNNIILNLAEVDYLSSAGLRVILLGAKKIKEKNGKLIICCLSGNAEEVFNLTGFSGIFPIFKTEEEAAGSL
ncbi:MAG: STAS domain-containing protein [Candidatus Wallbacteria bacterium]